MPPRPNTEQLRAFYHRYHNLPQVDVDQLWRGVAPEMMQLVARPIDILETTQFNRSVISGPTSTVNLDQVFGATDPLRGLVIRSIFWTKTAGGADPDDIEITMQTGNVLIWTDSNPSTGAVLGDETEPAGFGSRMPIVVMPGNTLQFRFHLVVAAVMAFRLDITGEEWETPIRNIGT